MMRNVVFVQHEGLQVFRQRQRHLPLRSALFLQACQLQGRTGPQSQSKVSSDISKEQFKYV